MQIHELTQPRLDEALGGLGSFMSGLTGGMSDKYMQKNSAAGQENTSEKWKERYTALQKDPTVTAYVDGLAREWAQVSATQVPASQGANASATLARVVPTLVAAAKSSNNAISSTQIGQLLATKAPTVWNNTADKTQAIATLSAELEKQGVTISDKTQPATTTVAPVKKPRTKYGKPMPVSVGPAVKSGQPTPAEQEKFQNLLRSKMNEATSPADARYADAFVKWTDQKLATRVPATGDVVTMDKVRAVFPDLAVRLQDQSELVARTKTPQDIAEYLRLGVAGVQARAQTFKNSARQVKQTNLGISPDQLASLKALAQTPAGKEMLRQQLGLF